MPTYHSSFNSGNDYKTICNIPILPLKTKVKGPALPAKEGAADRVLIYLILYIQQCLTKLGTNNKAAADKVLYQLSIENFAVPGDGNFALGGLVTKPTNRNETDTLRQYFTQLRQETGTRLLNRVYAVDESKPDKWWMCFQKRKFLNKNL